MIPSTTGISHKRPIIGVMGSGEDASKNDIRLAEELGEKIALNGWLVLTGGRDTGVMNAAARGAKKVPDSITIGILPDKKTKPSSYIDIPIISGIGEARNYINILTSHAVIACGKGGAGTSSEIALALKTNIPVILLDASAEAIQYFKTLAPDVISVKNAEEAIRTIRKLLATDENSSC